MDSLARLQGLIRGHLVRQAVSQVRIEFEQIADAIESPCTKVIWPDAAVLGKPRFVTVSRLSRERLHPTNASHQQCETLTKPVSDVRYPAIEKQPDDLVHTGQAVHKAVMHHNESTVEAAAATLSCCGEAADERDTLPLHSSSPHSNNRHAKEHPSASFEERQMLLSSCGVDSNSTVHVSDPTETAQVQPSRLRAGYSLSLCRDDTAFAGGSESESLSDNASNDQQEMHPNPIFKEENIDLESWLNCLPSDKVTLRAMHGDMLMELLWIEQAISSRIEYLAIKAKMGVQQS